MGNLKNGGVVDSVKCDIIGLFYFWPINEGKNEQKLALFCIFLTKMNRF